MATRAILRRENGLPDRTDPTALQARLPLGVLWAGGPGRRGLFCSRTGGGGGRGPHSGWRAGPRAREPPRALPAREGNGREGRARAARTHLPFQLHRSLEYCAPAPPSSTASSSSSGGGPGPGAGGLGHSCPARPPAARVAPRMLWLRLGRLSRVRATEQTLDPARPGGRAPSPGGQVARPPRLQGGRPPIPAGVGAAGAAGAAGPVRSGPRPPPPPEPLKSASPRSRSRLSWGAVPVPPLRPRPGSAPARRNSAPCARAPRPVRPAGRGGYPSLRRGRGAERRGRVAQGWDRLGRRGEERAARGTGRRAREGRARLESGISSGRGKGSSASRACKVRGRGRNPRPGVCADPGRAPGRQVPPAGRLSPEWPLGCSRGAWPCHCCVTSLRPSGMFLAPTLHGI